MIARTCLVADRRGALARQGAPELVGAAQVVMTARTVEQRDFQSGLEMGV
jgi:hypothetical protein